MIAEQEIQAIAQDHFVAEIGAEEKEKRRKRHNPRNVFLFVFQKPGRHELPHLPQHVRQTDENSSKQRQLDTHHEAFGGRQENKLSGGLGTGIASGFRMHVYGGAKGLEQEIQHIIREEKGQHAPQHHSDDASDQSPAQLLEMIEE